MALFPANVDKTMTAPVVALVAYDREFYRQLDKVFPHNPDAEGLFRNNEPLSQATGFRNGTLQAAYFMLALRAVGLDIGPMSGFDHSAVDREFFSDTSFRINLICGIGHGDASKLFKRLPRFEFREVATIL